MGAIVRLTAAANKSLHQTLFLIVALWVVGGVVLRFTLFYWLAHQAAQNICTVIQNPSTPLREMTYIIPDFDRTGPMFTSVLRKLRHTAFDDCTATVYLRDFFAERPITTATTLSELAQPIVNYAKEATPYTVEFSFYQRLPDGGAQLIAHFYLRFEYRLFDNTYDFLRHYVFVAPLLALGFEEYSFLPAIENPSRRPLMMSYRGYYSFEVLKPDGFHHLSLPTVNEL